MRILLLLLASLTPAFAAVSHFAPGQSVSAAVGSSATLAGTGFGTRRGKVFVGFKKGKVTSWTDTAITFVVPKTAPNGATVVEVADVGGTDVTATALTVTGSRAVLPKNKAVGVIGGKRFRPLIHFVFFMNTDWQLQMKTNNGKHARVLTFHVYGLGTLPDVFDGTESTPATLTYNDGKGTTWSGKPGAFTIAITHQEDSRFGGVIYGVVSAPDGRTIPIPGMQFVYATGL